MNTTLPVSCHPGHTSSLHSYHPGQTHTTPPTSSPSPHASPFGPTLSNKRRSHADLLFVPIKIKEKRSSCASTASNADSYRPDDTMDHPVWHPKSASAGSTAVQSRATAPLESQTSPSVIRKLSVTKGSGKAAAGGATSSPKTFQCTGYPGCNMVFTRSEHLARHERKHTGEKPYKCIVPNCPRTFSRYDNMIQHTQTHGDRTKRDSLSAAATAGGGSQSRPTSLQSTPLVAGRPRGGSSPGMFGAGYDDPHFPRSLQSSPAGASFGPNPAFTQQHHHPHHAYSPYYSHLQQQHQQQSSQWAAPSGAHANSSQGTVSGRHPSIHNGDLKPYLPASSGSSTPVIRTLKANSRSLPHLQPRSSPSVPSDSPGMSQHHGMSGMEIEELKRRKSEILLPSYSGSRSTNAYSQGHGIGLGMSPFTPTTSQSHSLHQVERLTPQEQERWNEHRRSLLAVHQPRRDSRGRMTPPDYSELSQGPASRSGSITQSYSGHPQPMSAQEKERLLEHRRSTPELMYDSSKAMKRSSNDPTDIIVQPLPSRDTRTGRQWYSQVTTSLPSSLTINPRSSSLAGREGPLAHGGSSSVASAGEDASTVLPPIAGSIDDHRQSRPRSHSSHIHPLSRPSEQPGFSFGSWPSSRESELQDRPLRLDPTLSPRLEQYLEDRHFPIRKREVLDFIERMDAREFFGLKSQVAETYANEQFRNPEFLGNMTAVLCAIQAPHPSLKRSDQRQLFGQSGNPRASNGSLKSISDLGSGVERSSNDMDLEEQERENSMDVDPSPHEGFAEQYQQQRVVLDIDMDSFRRDPEPDVRGLDGLSIKSLEPTTSFVAGFEPVMDYREMADGSRVSEEPPRSVSGYPLNARIGRFYLPKFAYRTRESLVAIRQLQEQQRLSPSGPWVCCQFEEYRGLWVWVLESVLEKYHEISLRHKMALTLVGARVYHPTPQFVQDEWSQQPHGHQQHDVVEVQESVLQPEMIQQVWRDMHQQYQHHRAQQQHQQQPHHTPYQQQQQHQPPQQFSPQPTHLPPPNFRAHPRPQMSQTSSVANARVATYEEYQRNLLPGDPRRRESFSQPGAGVPATTTTTQGTYYSDYRQHPQNLQREDLSSAPSSPRSPHHDDLFPEDNQTNESASSTPQQEASSMTTTTTTNMSTNNNMHRRISIAELCNPMQSLATERERDRFQREDSHFPSSSSSPSAANSKRSSM
ncbi:Up in starvation [Mortierella alpina]|nr:Up in starvation [Mortierella alpina]